MNLGEPFFDMKIFTRKKKKKERKRNFKSNLWKIYHLK